MSLRNDDRRRKVARDQEHRHNGIQRESEKLYNSVVAEL